jgi:hypothetical protein
MWKATATREGHVMTTATLKARPTTYNGVAMRSRLEASAAASFDRLGIAWTYEPRCFASPEGQYLPDFQLGSHSYIEVKPYDVPQEDSDRWERIIRESDPQATLTVLTEAWLYLDAGVSSFAADDPAKELYRLAMICRYGLCDHGTDHRDHGSANLWLNGLVVGWEAAAAQRNHWERSA